MARLEEYHKKRDFRRTPEPAGQSPGVREKEEGLFVVHKHDARRLHYDLRLEHEGVLESWAVPKGPALKAGEKRLAVRVEDHPLEYGDFEGVIPEGEYGAGTVMLWDRGRVRVQRRSDDRLDFVLEGHKLLGTWSLVRMSPRAAEDGDNWLLIKRRERTARRDRRVARAVAGLADLSVVSGRTMEQIATDRDRTWTSTGEADSDDSAPDPEAITAARRAPLPRNPRPQLATLAPAAPEGDGWLHEIKFDGYRIMARLEHGSVRLLSRNGKDWTNRFPAVAALLTGLPVTDVLLDGEMVALGKDGGSSFRHLQEALSAGRTQSLVYQVFDLLHLDGFDLGGVPLTERKRALTRLLESAGMVGSSRVRYTDHLEGQGPAFFEQVCRLGLEGIISKRSDKDYREGRSRHWLKVKCTRHEELLIGGYTEPRGARSAFGALLLGAWQGSRLVYAGKVGTGFSERQLETLLRELRALEVPDSPFDPPPDERGVHWVRPMLVAEVEYSEWTRDGRLRHPTFRGLREDREPEEIRLPEGAPAVGVAAAPASGGSSRREEAEVAGVRLSNPDRVLYPQQGVTKLALASYYEAIADWILPQLAGRPLSLLRCPQGRQKQCFFQKHPREAMANLPQVEIAEKGGKEPYVYVRRLSDLVALVQAGTLELHVWGSRVDDLERPDLMVFDLDPAADVPWSEVLRQAHALRERLAELDLASFVRTTGGKGLHLVVPLVPKADWDEVKAFARGVAQAHARDDRGRLTVNMSKARRQGRIFIDYLRNGRGATAIASYSTRAHEGAPVAVPVRWDELSPATRSDRYDIENLRRRLAALRGDPWEDFDDARHPLDRQLLAAVGAAGKE